MKHVFLFCTVALLISATPVMAAECSGWEAPKTYSGKFDDGFPNTLTIKKIERKDGECFLNLEYKISRYRGFSGRTDIVTMTQLTEEGNILFRTLGKDRGLMKYEPPNNGQIQGWYDPDIIGMRVGAHLTEQR